MREEQEEVLTYFAGKAKGYDLVDQQVYWRLSDELLWDALSKLLFKHLGDEFDFLDAGGGTGRWSKRILDEYVNARGTIYDLSPDMLSVSKEKQQKGLQKRLKLVQGDIEKMGDIEDNSYDLTFNFHNVLGFVESPERAINELTRVTRERGFVVSFIPNLYHNVFFNTLLGRINEAEHAVSTGKGRFTEDMPYMNMFTPGSIRELYEKSNLRNAYVIGFPITIYPGMQETQIQGSTENITNV